LQAVGKGNATIRLECAAVGKTPNSQVDVCGDGASRPTSATAPTCLGLAFVLKQEHSVDSTTRLAYERGGGRRRVFDTAAVIVRRV
jgi:hypothetical protein